MGRCRCLRGPRSPTGRAHPHARSTIATQFMKDEYSDGKSDLFAAFFYRTLGLVEHGGQLGFMSPFVWMFISSYQKVRERFTQDETITSLIQLEYSGFDGATVPICAFTLQRGHIEFKAAYVRLSNFVGAAQQAPRALEIIQAGVAEEHGQRGLMPDMAEHFYRASAADFAAIPGTPVVYWLSEKMRSAFVKSENGGSLGDACGIAQGITTGDNGRFLRLWWEVSRNKSEFERHHDSKTPTRTWQAADKGGDFRRWFGNSDWVIFWPEDGREIVNFSGSTPRNIHTRFKPSIACTKISSGGISFRAHERGFVFTDASVAATRDGDLDSVLGFANSSTATHLMAALAPTLNFEVGQIRSLPWLVDHTSEAVLSRIVMQLKSNAADDWNSAEASWGFEQNRLVVLAVDGG